MKIGVIQICSKLDPEENLKKIDNLLQTAVSAGVEAIFLPECFYSMSDGVESTPHLVMDNNNHYNNIINLAKDYKLFILGGSAATKTENGIVNRCYNFDPEGNSLGTYDKIHLFSCDITNSKGERKVINESEIYIQGDTPKIIEAKELKIGLSVCFDVRYPQMYQDYRDQGANIMSISAAFTVPTGKAHWHTLVRARAIENQCYVVAPAQWGVHNDKIRTYGHSLIIDPWGEILVDAEEGEKLIVSDIDISKIDEIRGKVKL